MKEDWFIGNPLLEHHLKQVAKNKLVWISFGLVLGGWLFAITRPPSDSKTPFVFLSEIFALWFLMPLLAKELMEGSREQLRSCSNAGQFIIAKLFPLAVVLFPMHLFCAVLMWFGILPFDFNGNFEGMMKWWTLSQSIVLAWSILIIALIVWLAFRWGNASKAVATVLIGQTVFWFISDVAFSAWLSAQGRVLKCIVISVSDFLARKYPWFQRQWMFSIPLAPALYNPTFALMELWNISGHPPAVHATPQYWGSCQTFVYLALAGIFIALFANSVAKEIRKSV